MAISILFILLITTITITLPIGVAMGLSTLMVITLVSQKLSVLTMAQNTFAGLDSFPLLAIPFFVLAGELMGKGGVSKRLLKLADAMLGYITGGLGMVTTIGCMFFAAISGSGPATVSAMGTIMMPAMEEKGYDKGYAAALTATAGSIGVIIPPSIPFVLYGVVTGTSIGALFLAGIIPGILIGSCIMLANYIMSKKYNYVGSGKRVSFTEFFSVLKEAFWALLAPVIILGGIYGGIFTPTEAAVVGAVYALIIGIFIYKELKFKEIYECLRDTMIINGATNFIIGLSTTFANFLTIEQAPAKLANLLMVFSSSPWVVMLIINVMLLIIGMFIDNISSCIILAPILLPIVMKFGMNPVHFGIIMTVNLAIGFVTPPYGANLFVASAVGSVSMSKIIKFIIPFIFALLISLLFITVIPGLSLFLPNLLSQ